MPFSRQPSSRVAVARVQQCLRLAHALGLPLETAAAGAGLALAPLPEAPDYVDGTTVEQLLALGLRLLDDPLPGLAAAAQRGAGAFSLADFQLQEARTVGTLLAMLIRQEPQDGDLVRTHLHLLPPAPRLGWNGAFADAFVREHMADFMLATYAGLVAGAAGPGLRVVQAVHLRHAAPAAALRRRYPDAFGCAVYFGQPDDALLLAPHALDLALPSADPALSSVLARGPRRPARGPQPRLLDLARTLLHALLADGSASREGLAAQLGVHPRTLHNKLVEAGTSYRELLDELRRRAPEPWRPPEV